MPGIDGVEVVQCAHIDPGAGDGEDEVGMAEAQLGQLLDPVFPLAQLLADEVGAGDAEMDAACRQFAGDFAGGEQHQLDIVDAVDEARVFAVGAGAAQFDAAGAEPFEGLFHQPALGGDAKLHAHAAPPRSMTRPGRMTPPTAGISRPRPSWRVSAS